MWLSWLSFFREMPIYSFVNMTDIMSFPIQHQAQIKNLFWVYKVKTHFSFSFLILTVVLFTLVFCHFFVVSVVWRDNHIAKHTRQSRTALSLSQHTHTHILWLMANFTWMTFFYLLLVFMVYFKRHLSSWAILLEKECTAQVNTYTQAHEKHAVLLLGYF